MSCRTTSIRSQLARYAAFAFETPAEDLVGILGALLARLYAQLSFRIAMAAASLLEPRGEQRYERYRAIKKL